MKLRGKILIAILFASSALLPLFEARPARADQPYSVRFYTAPAWCPYCRKTQIFFDSEGLSSAGAAIPIQAINIDVNPSREERTSKGVPELQLFRGNTRVRVHIGAIASRAEWESFVAAPDPVAAGPVATMSTKPRPPMPGSPPPAPEVVVPGFGKVVEVTWAAQTARRTEAASGRIALNPIALKNPTASSAVLLMGTGHGPEENPISVGLSLREIRGTLLGSFHLMTSALVTLYGFGAEAAPDPEAYEISGDDPRGHRTHVAGLSPNATFSQGNLLGTLKSMRDERITHALLVFAGHGSQSGVSMWQTEGQEAEPMLDPRTLKNFIGASGVESSVIVSGNCFGGKFAQAASCGFFAARPDSVATGCSPETGKRDHPGDARDYLSIFFKGISGAHGSFADAHWNAVLKTLPTDSPYSSVDYLVDQHFYANPDDMPQWLSKDEILGLRSFGRLAEQRAYDTLLANWLTTEQTVTRINLRQLRNGADTKVLPLMRRLLFRRLIAKSQIAAEVRQELRRIDACEGQELSDFLKAKSASGRAIAGKLGR